MSTRDEFAEEFDVYLRCVGWLLDRPMPPRFTIEREDLKALARLIGRELEKAVNLEGELAVLRRTINWKDGEIKRLRLRIATAHREITRIQDIADGGAGGIPRMAAPDPQTPQTPRGET